MHHCAFGINFQLHFVRLIALVLILRYWQLILVILRTGITCYCFTVSLQPPNVRLRQTFQPQTARRPTLWTAFADHWTGPDLAYHAHRFISYLAAVTASQVLVSFTCVCYHCLHQFGKTVAALARCETRLRDCPQSIMFFQGIAATSILSGPFGLALLAYFNSDCILVLILLF